jgi:hypothetical protein
MRRFLRIKAFALFVTRILPRLGFNPVSTTILRIFRDRYKSFAATCADIAAELNQAGIASPFPSKSSWRPSDVEAALFAWANEWN